MKRFITQAMLAGFCGLAVCTIATAQNFHRSFTSSNQSRSNIALNAGRTFIDVVNQPLGEALQQVAASYQRDLLIDSSAQSQLERTITVKTNCDCMETASRELAGKADLFVVPVADGRLAVTATPMTSAEAMKCDLISLREIKVNQALQRQVPLMMFHTPVEMGLQMAEGFGGITIKIDRNRIAAAGIDLLHPVTLQGNADSLANSLDAMLHPIGLAWYVDGGQVIVTTKVRHPRTQLNPAKQVGLGV